MQMLKNTIAYHSYHDKQNQYQTLPAAKVRNDSFNAPHLLEQPRDIILQLSVHISRWIQANTQITTPLLQPDDPRNLNIHFLCIHLLNTKSETHVTIQICSYSGRITQDIYDYSSVDIAPISTISDTSVGHSPQETRAD